mmetsp:Transcript_21719/g.28012  ORF Transcript_21719/g.28012 Transcript_21719/m.28012 type:complete len:202 (-) Transcript_21719:381-986(-)
MESTTSLAFVSIASIDLASASATFDTDIAKSSESFISLTTSLAMFSNELTIFSSTVPFWTDESAATSVASIFLTSCCATSPISFKADSSFLATCSTVFATSSAALIDSRTSVSLDFSVFIIELSKRDGFSDACCTTFSMSTSALETFFNISSDTAFKSRTAKASDLAPFAAASATASAASMVSIIAVSNARPADPPDASIF